MLWHLPLHAKFQLPSFIVVDVTAVGAIIRIVLMNFNEAFCLNSAPTHLMLHYALSTPTFLQKYCWTPCAAPSGNTLSLTGECRLTDDNLSCLDWTGLRGLSKYCGLVRSPSTIMSSRKRLLPPTDTMVLYMNIPLPCYILCIKS